MPDNSLILLLLIAASYSMIAIVVGLLAQRLTGRSRKFFEAAVVGAVAIGASGLVGANVIMPVLGTMSPIKGFGLSLFLSTGIATAMFLIVPILKAYRQ
jgi:hypothetical protein